MRTVDRSKGRSPYVKYAKREYKYSSAYYVWKDAVTRRKNSEGKQVVSMSIVEADSYWRKHHGYK